MMIRPAKIDEDNDVSEDVRVFLTAVQDAKKKVSSLGSGIFMRAERDEASDTFSSLVSIMLPENYEALTCIDSDSFVDRDMYGFLMELLEGGDINSLAVEGSGYQEVEGWAEYESVTVSEFIDDAKLGLISLWSSTFPEYERARQKELGRNAWDKKRLDSDRDYIPHVEGSESSRWHGVKEKKISRVGKQLFEPKPSRESHGYRYMSVDKFLTRHLISASGINPTEQTVFRALLDYVDFFGRTSMSQERIADRCNISERSVLRAVKSLEACGMLVKIKQGNSKKKLANLYQITLSCVQMESSEKMLAFRQWALTGKFDLEFRLAKYGVAEGGVV